MEHVNNKMQLERILFFSDGVMAIAITLLIIEIKAPHFGDYNDSEKIHEFFSELIPKFISFLISFFVIAIYWKAHHHLYGFVNNFTDKLIWINMFFLLTIVILPFTTAFYSENVGYNLAYAIYCFNVFLTGIVNFWLVRYIASNKTKVSFVSGDVLWRKYYSLRSLVAPLVFFLSMFFSFYSSMLSRMSFLLIFPIIYFLNKHYKKKLHK
jgi:uncharacterized membrane protein